MKLSQKVAKGLKKQTKAMTQAEAQKEEQQSVEVSEVDIFEQFAQQQVEETAQKTKEEDEMTKLSPLERYEYVCQQDLQKAHDMNKPDPDFDFRTMYAKGEKVHFVRVLASLGEKEIMEVTIRTIYPRMMVGCVKEGRAECIGYNERDLIFRDYGSALREFNTIQVSNRFAESEWDEDTGKKKRKRKNVDVEKEDGNVEINDGGDDDE